ncbi:EamA family transporter [Shewanella sp. JNE10-2]|uniref:DMT family transporter n=2 Tax=Shewanella TaxID=22 RepID=UPI002002C8AA|nr:MULTISPECIES: EamA family transporter [unclassified Shewanella]MCK7631464.1 EamA family transporter [Shewanella sp. JNE9-1]MCK7646740.1 EamA family transporter [Shewanella sp. JNE3-1]MCK7654724.1 EamA family transporter [Shewanella sp. JNE4-1]UPO28504.1 EamA family transporter [Shewanella sp. JNE10-2]UPO35713.1 EamA family transporter [Shewanella sp. JNE7]
MPFVIALLAPVFWGTTYALVSLYLHDMSPYWVAVWRALPAGILMLMLRPRLPTLVWSKLGLLAFCNIGAFFALLFIGAYRLPGAVAGTLGATLPLIFLILAWLIDKKRPGIKWLLLGLMGLGGVILLLNPSADLDPIGVLCMLSATTLIAFSSRWMQKWDVGDFLVLTAWQLLLGGLMLIPLAWFMAGPAQLPSMTLVPSLIWLAIANTAVAYWAWLWSMRNLGPEIMGMVALVNPVVAVSLGVLIVGETLDMRQWMGIAVILLSLLLMKLPQNLRLNPFKKVQP